MEEQAGNAFISCVSGILSIVFYIYMAYSLQTIARKTNVENGWFAWVPFLNIYLTIKIAGQPGWWLLLLLIPVVNIVVAVYIWMRIAEAVDKPSWLGILMLVPIANLIVPGYLAFSD